MTQRPSVGNDPVANFRHHAVLGFSPRIKHLHVCTNLKSPFQCLLSLLWLFVHLVYNWSRRSPVLIHSILKCVPASTYLSSVLLVFFSHLSLLPLGFISLPVPLVRYLSCNLPRYQHLGLYSVDNREWWMKNWKWFRRKLSWPTRVLLPTLAGGNEGNHTNFC